MRDRDDFCSTFVNFTYDELKKEVDEEFSLMSDDEKLQRARDGSPTFKHTILCSIKEGQSVEINESTCQYNILKKNICDSCTYADKTCGGNIDTLKCENYKPKE